jgi:hypothetical protein
MLHCSTELSNEAVARLCQHFSRSSRSTSFALTLLKIFQARHGSRKNISPYLNFSSENTQFSLAKIQRL